MNISTLCSNSKYLIDMDRVISSLENSYTVLLRVSDALLLLLVVFDQFKQVSSDWEIIMHSLASQVVSHKNTRIDTHPVKDHKKYYYNAYKQRRELKEIPFIGHWIIFRVILLLSCYARRGHLWNAGLSYQR